MIEKSDSYKNNNNIERERINNIIDKLIKFNKVLYVYGPTGSGKTIAVSDYVNKYLRDFTWYECEEIDNVNGINTALDSILAEKNRNVFIFDKFEFIYEEKVLKKIVQCIENSKDIHKFIFISSKRISRCFTELMIKNRIGIITKQQLCFNKNELNLLLKLDTNQDLTDIQLDGLLELTNGYPILITLSLVYSKLNYGKINFDKFLDNEYFREVFTKKFWNRLSKKKREQLIILSLFPEVSLEQAKYITKDEFIEELLDEMVFFYTDKKYIFNTSLIKIIREKYSDIDEGIISESYKNMGKYCENTGDYIEAAYYYSKANLINNEVRVLEKFCNSSILINNFKLIKRYLNKLPKYIIEENAILCSWTAMIEIIYYNHEESIKWIERINHIKRVMIEKYSQYENKQECDEKIKLINDRLITLYSIYPEDKSDEIREIFKQKKENLRLENSSLSNISVTGNFTSVIRGIQDKVVDWSNYDSNNDEDKLILKYVYSEGYKFIVEFALAEIEYEKNNMNTALVSLSAQTINCKDFGNIDLEFIRTILTTKVQIANERIRDSKLILEALEKKIKKCKANHLIKNLDATVARYNLLIGNVDEAKKWMVKYGKETEKKFLSIYMYEYLTKARVYIGLNQYHRAAAFLEILYTLNEKYNHNINVAECLILQSIALNRIKEEELAFSKIEEALKRTQSYGFIRIYADEGEAIYEVINKYIKYDKKDTSISLEYIKSILIESKNFAKLYPKYLNKKMIDENQMIKLTKSEKEVIHLILKGMSNGEIGEYLNVKIDTVKFHIKNIYSKLNVKNRMQAITVAKELNII